MMSVAISDSFSATCISANPLPLDNAKDRLLIVDDDPQIRILFGGYLSDRYQCDLAWNYDHAIEQLSSADFALVICDMIMPGRSGVELLREISARFPDTAVIMVSGVDRTQRVIDTLRLGAYDYLIKPCELDVLEMTIERALERRSLLRSARQYKIDLEQQNAELARSRETMHRLQAQVVQSEKMASLGQLAAGIAHELNNPAGFIYGNMDMLGDCVFGLERLLGFYDSVPLDSDAAKRVASIKHDIDYARSLSDLHSIINDCHQGALRIRDVVENLRIFSRLDEAEFKKIDIHESLESTIRLLSRYYSSGHINLVREYGELPMIGCFAGQLNQVWMNLLVNAAQAIEVDGEVRITTSANSKHVFIRISDTGCGIEPEHVRKIFDPFFTTKEVGEGVGLGLSVSYGIIERHSGSITVESDPGNGSAFTVAIPIDT